MKFTTHYEIEDEVLLSAYHAGLLEEIFYEMGHLATKQLDEALFRLELQMKHWYSTCVDPSCGANNVSKKDFWGTTHWFDPRFGMFTNNSTASQMNTLPPFVRQIGNPTAYSVLPHGTNYPTAPSTANIQVRDNFEVHDISVSDILRTIENLKGGMLTLKPGKMCVKLPDGTIVALDDDGNFTIQDQDAKVQYKANRIREFSPYVNAADLVSDFIRYVGSLGLKQSEAKDLSIELFIRWLIVEAATRDGDPVPEDVPPVVVEIESRRKQPRCLVCSRFVSKLKVGRGWQFCSVKHAERYAAQLEAA